MNQPDLGLKVAELRHQKGLTQEQLPERCEVCARTIQPIGSEEVDPRAYNNSFWANRYTTANGFDGEFWVPHMLRVSGNVVALFPNGITYYDFSDNQEFTCDVALLESDKIISLCH